MNISSCDRGHGFEKTVVEILYATDAYKISHFDGGADRGRDIIATYKIDGMLYHAIVQCKNYSKSVNVQDISSSLDWAKIHRPNLFYLWVNPRLTVDAKDYLENFSKTYHIQIDYEENENIELYMKAIREGNTSAIDILKSRIISNLQASMAFKQPLFSESDCYLVDREIVSDALKDDSYKSFYVQGVSCCGKTQLVKNVAMFYYGQNYKVFWFTFHDAEPEVQLKTFWESFALFSCLECGNHNINHYFESFGYHHTIKLNDLVFQLLAKNQVAIFIDDVHKCRISELTDFFRTLIEKKSCVIFFVGWFNIFDNSPLIQKSLKSIILDGLNADNLSRIITHNTGKVNYAVALKIEQEYNGLPGFAAIVDEETKAEDFESDTTFLFSLLDCLSKEEKIALFSFIGSSSPLPETLFAICGYYEAFQSLLRKKLILKQERGYVIHEKYGLILKSYPLDRETQESVVKILRSYCKNDSHIVLDIALTYIHSGDAEQALKTLNDYFDILLHQQPAIEILTLYQEIEKSHTTSAARRNIMLHKAILEERCENYSLSQMYIDIIKNVIWETAEEWQQLFYVELRCLYFQNSYDAIFEKIKQNHEYIRSSGGKFLINIMLMVGRIYYIRGLFEEAAYFYLIAYSEACMISDDILIVKIIHRISMVELKLGFVKESLSTFSKLIDMDALITIKRKSYIYYRIAECEYYLEDFDKALYYNHMSMKIKESLNHKRGEIFCRRLNAKIALRNGDYINAICEVTLAAKIAQDLNLHKEEIGSTMLYCKILKAAGQDISNDILSKIKQHFQTSVQEKNIKRLRQIADITNDICDSLSHKADEEINRIESLLLQEFSEQSAPWKDRFVPCLKWYEILINGKKSISKKLLINAGLYDPFM